MPQIFRSLPVGHTLHQLRFNLIQYEKGTIIEIIEVYRVDYGLINSESGVKPYESGQIKEEEEVMKFVIKNVSTGDFVKISSVADIEACSPRHYDFIELKSGKTSDHKGIYKEYVLSQNVLNRLTEYEFQQDRLNKWKKELEKLGNPI